MGKQSKVKCNCYQLESWMEYGEVVQDCKLGKLLETGGCRKNCGSYLPTINCVKELAEGIGCSADIQSISRAIYKGTECGAWVDEKDGAIRVGSIVEGSDAEVIPIVLSYPFTMKEFWDACDRVNREACELWKECNDAES